MIDGQKSSVSYHIVELYKILEGSTTISSSVGGRNKVINCSGNKVCINCLLLGFCFPKLARGALPVCFVWEIVL